MAHKTIAINVGFMVAFSILSLTLVPIGAIR